MIASDAYRAPKQRGAKEQKDLERKALGFFYFFQRNKIFQHSHYFGLYYMFFYDYNGE